MKPFIYIPCNAGTGALWERVRNFVSELEKEPELFAAFEENVYLCDEILTADGRTLRAESIFDWMAGVCPVF